jgi:hypothetical protein
MAGCSPIQTQGARSRYGLTQTRQMSVAPNACDKKESSMPIDIDKLTESELVDLNHRIVARLRFLQQMRAHTSMLAFSLGERVTSNPTGIPCCSVSSPSTTGSRLLSSRKRGSTGRYLPSFCERSSLRERWVRKAGKSSTCRRSSADAGAAPPHWRGCAGCNAASRGQLPGYVSRWR